MTTFSELKYLDESKNKPKNIRLWNQAKRIAQMDQKYSANTARILTKRIYLMMGGAFEIHSKGKK